MKTTSSDRNVFSLIYRKSKAGLPVTKTFVVDGPKPRDGHRTNLPNKRLFGDIISEQGPVGV